MHISFNNLVELRLVASSSVLWPLTWLIRFYLGLQTVLHVEQVTLDAAGV